MRSTESLRIVGYLAGLTSGWTDDSIALYAAEIEQLDDYDIGLAAAQQLMRSWKETWRPPLATFLEAYRAEHRRVANSTGVPQLGRRQDIMPVEEGLKVAWDAYNAECVRQGREPNKPMFTGWARKVGA